MKPVEVSRQARFTDRAHPAMNGRRVLESAELRSRRLAELLDGFKGFAADDLTSLLADHGPSGTPSETTVCVHGSFRATAACLQFFPRSRRMRVDYAHACEARFEEIGL